MSTIEQRISPFVTLTECLALWKAYICHYNINRMSFMMAFQHIDYIILLYSYTNLILNYKQKHMKTIQSKSTSEKLCEWQKYSDPRSGTFCMQN